MGGCCSTGFFPQGDGGLDFSELSTTGADAGELILRPYHQKGTVAFISTSGTAYFVYLGKTMKAIIPKFVEFRVNVGGTGAQTAEAGFFSTPAPPNKANQSLTKLVATGAVDTLTTAAVKRNTAAFGVTVPANTHLWAGLRVAMATTQPDLTPIGRDFLQGGILTIVASGVLTGAGPFAGVIPADAAEQAPLLSGALV